MPLNAARGRDAATGFDALSAPSLSEAILELGELLVSKTDRAPLSSDLAAQCVTSTTSAESRKALERALRVGQVPRRGVSGPRGRQPLLLEEP